jgi:CRP-like cAMP-binding protein
LSYASPIKPLIKNQIGSDSREQGNPDSLDIFVQTISRYARLRSSDTQALNELPFTFRRLTHPGTISTVKLHSEDCTILLSGIAFGYKITSTGTRQIISLFLPGDIVDVQRLFFGVIDCSITTLTPAKIANIRKSDFEALVQAHPRIAQALTASVAIEASISREWIVNVGRRDAKSRIAHLLCEFAARMEARELTEEYGLFVPMTQDQIGDALGLTPVHVNRMLRALENEGLIARKGSERTLPNLDALREAGDFTDAYLCQSEGRGSAVSL